MIKIAGGLPSPPEPSFPLLLLAHFSKKQEKLGSPPRFSLARCHSETYLRCSSAVSFFAVFTHFNCHAGSSAVAISNRGCNKSSHDSSSAGWRPGHRLAKHRQ